MPLKALWRKFGFGKDKEATKSAVPRHHPYDEISDEHLAMNKQARKVVKHHPYDEVSDEQLQEKRKSPRVHPYDEVSDAVLEENRAKRPAPRRHDYDQVDLDRTMSKMGKNPNTKASNNPLNYVEVQLPAGMTEDELRAAKRKEQPTIYSEVRSGGGTSGETSGGSPN